MKRNEPHLIFKIRDLIALCVNGWRVWLEKLYLSLKA